MTPLCYAMSPGLVAPARLVAAMSAVL